MTVVGETPSGWWAACGHPGCYWIVTGRASERSAVRQRDLHLAWEHYGFGCTAQPVDRQAKDHPWQADVTFDGPPVDIAEGELTISRRIWPRP